MKFQSYLNNLANFFIFLKNMVNCPVTYVTKCMRDMILKTISIKHKIVNFKEHLPTVVQTSTTLYCHKVSAGFTYFMFLAGELFLQSRLTFREHGPMKDLSKRTRAHDGGGEGVNFLPFWYACSNWMTFSIITFSVITN